jgi:hypothetical protein
MIKKREMENGIREAIMILQGLVGDIVIQQPKHTGVKSKVYTAAQAYWSKV